jgi:uncharacterized protein
VHQDGLVHISMMSQKFIKDPREVVKAGDVVRVKVLEVDLQRKRVALTMRLEDAAARTGSGTQPERHIGRPLDRSNDRRPTSQGQRSPSSRPQVHEAAAPASNGMMAEAFAKALKK